MFRPTCAALTFKQLIGNNNDSRSVSSLRDQKSGVDPEQVRLTVSLSVVLTYS